MGNNYKGAKINQTEKTNERELFECSIPSGKYSDWFGKGDTREDIIESAKEYGIPDKVFIHGNMGFLVYSDKVIACGYDGHEYTHHYVATQNPYTRTQPTTGGDTLAFNQPPQDVERLFEMLFNFFLENVPARYFRGSKEAAILELTEIVEENPFPCILIKFYPNGKAN